MVTSFIFRDGRINNYIKKVSSKAMVIDRAWKLNYADSFFTFLKEELIFTVTKRFLSV